jgi:ATP-dependent DNA helicase RecG
LDGGILVSLFKDKYSIEQLKSLGLNERQITAVEYVKANGKITNYELQQLLDLSERTILRELEDLVKNNVLARKGERKGTFYELK